MTINNELFITLLSLFTFLIGYLISFAISKIKEKKIVAVDYIYIVLTLIENFINANPDLIENSWNKFYSKVKAWIEKNIKIDFTEEQWKLINEKLLELYEKLKSELKTEQSQ